MFFVRRFGRISYVSFILSEGSVCVPDVAVAAIEVPLFIASRRLED